MKLYDLGVELQGRKPELVKALAWPVNAWACYIPENMNLPLNIFEKLILSIIDKGLVKTRNDLKHILANQIGLKKELVDNIVNECCDQYTDLRYKTELKLDAEAKIMLQTMIDGISVDMKMSDKTKRIYLFQDLITGAVIPCFNVEKLPADYEAKEFDDKDCIALRYNHTSSQPRTAAINNGLYYWARIQRNKQNDETEIESHVDMDAEPIQDVNEDVDLFETEEEPKTLADKENAPKKLNCITIYDDNPTELVLEGYVAFDPNNPTCIEIFSPFGKEYDNWFMKAVNRDRSLDSDFNEELELFLMEKTETFKDVVPFGDEKIQLYNDFPSICNNVKYKKLKKAILDLSKDYERFQNGDDESTNFAKNLRTALDVLFREVIKANPEMYSLKNNYVDYYQQKGSGLRKYKQEIAQIVDSQRLNISIQKRLGTESIFRNVTSTYGGPENGNTKDCAALILLFANKNPNSAAMEFVSSYQNVFLDIIELVDLGNNAAHAGDSYTTMSFSPKEVEAYYAQYENIVRVTYPLLIEGANHVEKK